MKSKKVLSLLAGLLMSFPLMAVNINTASVEELSSIKGIGPATAEKIVKYREQNVFKSIEEIKNVKGIGEKTFEKIRKELEV